MGRRRRAPGKSGAVSLMESQGQGSRRGRAPRRLWLLTPFWPDRDVACFLVWTLHTSSPESFSAPACPSPARWRRGACVYVSPGRPHRGVATASGGAFIPRSSSHVTTALCCCRSQPAALWAHRQMPDSRGVRLKATKRRAPSLVWGVSRSPKHSPCPSVIRGPHFNLPVALSIGGHRREFL